ncbi:quinone oxidoreductase family protein [Nitrogeniibacter aestuarii]|uniref:quinone oxidoreductase family protein n=1 Tax=Nitrogeniibacter aestuarii TaxID=2815343 RepID=UPI001E41F5EA|nr:quinone oxidoreductase [Nitrogeniibacter aestuarii]
MSHAIRFDQTGGPDVLQWVPLEVPPPGPGEVSLTHTAVGLNYIDTYHRSGLYPVPMPSGLGCEAAGVITALGDGVDGFSVGDRVAYASGPLGAYAEARTLPASVLVRLPDAISDEVAAAVMLQGLTAQYLLRQTYPVEAGETILVHAAAGGVGLLMCQWAKHLGVTVIGTVGSPEKAALAKANGCDHTILYRQDSFLDAVKDITGGEGVPVVYDAVGKDTFMDSLACLQPMGTMVSFGNASGAVPPIDIGILAKMGSLFLTRPTLFSYIADRERLDAMAADLFNVIAKGAVKVQINQRYPLVDAAQAHRDLEARNTTGSTVLVVS